MKENVFEYKPTNYIPRSAYDNPTVFVAGSIEMGSAVDWQVEFINNLTPVHGFKYVAFNPRRDDWDASWVQSIDNPQFNSQVTWELDQLDAADVVALYLAPGTISPISLLEFGLYYKKMIVCCPHGFERKGNVDIVCERLGITTVSTLAELAERVSFNLMLAGQRKDN